MWRKGIEREKSALEVLSDLMDKLSLLDSPLGRLALESQKDDVPPRADSPKARGDDLLPFDLKDIEAYLEKVPETPCKSVKLVALTLNYLWLGGRDAARYRPERRGLTKCQRAAIDHLLERVEDLGEVEKLCPDMSTGQAQLVEAKFDYAGDPVMSLEELTAAQVIPVWPAFGEAAVQPVVDYLPAKLRSQIEDPVSCLLPVDEWPVSPPRSKVRASQEEWNLIVKAAAARGLMVGVAASEVFRDHNGELFLNGAAVHLQFHPHQLLPKAPERGRPTSPISGSTHLA